ncbi:hypothetical protein GGI20_005218 [Coemansia sp. BCRC 34301]|nr:hypothetical protein GGI20_005218 [Coemansia sp. BCRC 34301]
MRFYLVLTIVFSCLLALCNSTFIGISNATSFKNYEALDTTCHKVDPWYNEGKNKITVSGTATYVFANDDCTNLVGIGYHTPWVWQSVARPIRSFMSTENW